MSRWRYAFHFSHPRFLTYVVGIFSYLLIPYSFSNPVLNNVASGQANVIINNNQLTINQISPKAILNWKSFNIQSYEHTHFQQPNGGIVLNRINPLNGASKIYGMLTATGQIILVNPAGLYFGPSAFVNVGGIVATTANIHNQNFLNGNYQFIQNNAFPKSMIINRGAIIAAEHGLAALVAPQVINTGVIQANLGTVVLGSASAFTINFDGTNLVNFAINQKATGARIFNSGLISANGGKVIISAQSASKVLDGVINMSGIVEAKSVGFKNGEIILLGSPDSGTIKVSGKLLARGENAGELGGIIKITAQKVFVIGTAVLDASGKNGGGKIFIGGNDQGQGPLPNAKQTIVGKNSLVAANAIDFGDGGEIIVWSDASTTAQGYFSASGGAKGGNGGFVETASNGYLNTIGIRVNVLAPFGRRGIWVNRIFPFRLLKIANVSNIIIQPIVNSDADGPLSMTPPFLLAEKILSKNIDSMLKEIAERYDANLKRVKINPYCYASP